MATKNELMRPDHHHLLGSQGGNRWYVVQVKPNCGQISRRNLERQHFEVFYPIYEETRRRGSRFLPSSSPLFPGYFFVSFDPASAPWRVINNTYGVARLVSLAGHEPTPVPRGLVEALRSRCDDLGHLQPIEFLPGEKVTITQGPLAQFTATVEQLAPQKRVWVLLDLMGQKTRIALPISSLRSSEP